MILRTREYFGTDSIVDIRTQYSHGSPAMERQCNTKSWNLRLFQTVMEKVLLNGLFPFKLKTGKSQCPRGCTNVVAQALCADEEEEAGDGAAGRTRAEKQSRISKSAVAPPSVRIEHVLV